MGLSSVGGCAFVSVFTSSALCISSSVEWRCWFCEVSALFGSKVSLSDGVARWDESVLLLFAPSSSSSCYFIWPLSAVVRFSSMFLSLCFSLAAASFLSSACCFLVLFLFRPPPWLRSAFCWGVSSTRPFLSSPLVSAVLVSFVAVVFPVLCLLMASAMGSFVDSFLRLGSPFSVSLSSSSLWFSHTWLLRVRFFRPWFRSFQLCSSSPLCVRSILLVSALGTSFTS